MTLLYLLSHETMQNLFVLAALQPDKVLQVSSNDPIYGEKAKHLKSAYKRFCKLHDLKMPEFLPVVTLDSATPNISETKIRVEQLYEQYPDLVINYTGATKQMSIGAYLVALNNKIPSWYCDTQQGKIISGETDQASWEPFKIGEIFDRFDSTMVMAANGYTSEKWHATKNLKEGERQLGEMSFSLLSDDSSGFRDYFKDLEKKVKAPELTMPNPPNERVKEYLDLAVELGLLKYEDGIFKLNKSGKKKIDEAIKSIYGDSFEYYVHSRLLESRRYFDIRRGVITTDVASETDFICLDRQSRSLVLVSCKSSSFGANKLEHLESIMLRKNRMGGSFSKAILCVGKSLLKNDELQKKCRLFNIQLLVGEEIEAHFKNT